MRPSWLPCLLVLNCAISLAAATREVPPEAAALARRLAAEDFNVRQSAAMQLGETPDVALLPWLAEVARREDREAALRALRIIEQWMVTAPQAVAEAAERQLEELANGGTGGDARDILTIHHELREQRALATLREMGAKIDVGPDIDALREMYNIRHAEVDYLERDLFIEALIQPHVHDDGLDASDDAQDNRTDPAKEQVARRRSLPNIPQAVYLTPKWTGGNKGARQLRRLAGAGTSLTVYIVNGCNTSLEAVKAATAEFEHVTTQERGPCLGIGNGGGYGGCVVGRVLDGGAADHAGLQAGDVIRKFGDAPISSFTELVEHIQAAHQPGETVKVSIERSLQEMELEVTLGDWTQADTESQLWTGDNRGFGFPRRRIFIPPPQQPRFQPQPNQDIFPK